jgi:photosynthetic reaction center cytochrome c subunit
MNFGFILKLALALGVVGGTVFVLNTFEHPPATFIQWGYRGLAMDQVYNPKTVAAEVVTNAVPKPEDPQDPAGQPSSAVYANVKVLKDLDASEFLRLMQAMTDWVAPKEGCNYCHTDNPAEDTKYTKVVARRMLQMVHQINGNWQTHVGSTGVTCYTCHRGQPVPANIWFADPGTSGGSGMAQGYTGKNSPTKVAAYASLPSDVFLPYLDQANEIRVLSTTALPEDDHHSIKQTEWTYGLMMHISQSLGVNCTFCHNTRSFAAWDQSTPQRSTAWYGIRMVRDLNTHYLDPLAGLFPANRLGPTGDGPKLNCATCHAGVYKPLFGVSMLPDYPELAATGPIDNTASDDYKP